MVSFRPPSPLPALGVAGVCVCVCAGAWERAKELKSRRRLVQLEDADLGGGGAHLRGAPALWPGTPTRIDRTCGTDKGAAEVQYGFFGEGTGSLWQGVKNFPP